ncbi:hypothetical protein RHMOL_Rhmol10G0264800 [Rhododendron molle]|uniref:Uncharacterized protein n=1 Tax=Rhododendron molle TaxID=49168 RepID=A0ACC0M6T0_RHOML|nr:hypothetical protein RHMOL_Rhmol10G0264800 [Rhododendron molle]
MEDCQVSLSDFMFGVSCAKELISPSILKLSLRLLKVTQLMILCWGRRRRRRQRMPY